GTTLPVIIPTALTGLVAYARGGFVDARIAVPAALGGAGFAVVGALATSRVRGELLLIATAALILFLSVRMLRERTGVSQATARGGTALYLGVGAVSGFVSGLLGLGGGVVLVPVFTGLLRLPIKVALGTSLAVIAAQAVPGTIVHERLGNIDWAIALGLTVGVIPGARIGSRLAVRASDRRLRLAVGVAMGLMAVLFGGSEIVALMT
ncbi:MAG TPA: sulfite exporter TauE/SafE family protein, partial [Actinomycetota bacterium]|nr:sulfite exporter TauE/SafE family protein [Actinomycetota bacterium]